LNAWQFLKQFQYLLRDAAWSGGNKLFPSNAVVITANLDQDFLGRIRFPCAIIRVQDATYDEEHDEEPDLLMQRFDVTIAVAHPNDPSGEAAFMGAGRANQNDSAGKGLLELEAKLWATVKGLGESNGVRIYSRGKGASNGTKHPNSGYMAWRTYRFEAELGDDFFYHPSTHLTAVDGGGGTVDLTWALPATRFDYRRMVLRRASGSTAPTSISSGTGVVLGGTPDGASATSVTDSPGVGTWSYALFAVYDPYTADTDFAASDAVTETVTTA